MQLSHSAAPEASAIALHLTFTLPFSNTTWLVKKQRHTTIRIGSSARVMQKRCNLEVQQPQPMHCMSEYNMLVDLNGCFCDPRMTIISTTICQ